MAIASATRPISSVVSTTSAVSANTAAPRTPSAMPTVAVASAGASLTPSPTMVTTRWRSMTDRSSATFRSGSRLARTVAIPVSRAMAATVGASSPSR